MGGLKAAHTPSLFCGVRSCSVWIARDNRVLSARARSDAEAVKTLIQDESPRIINIKGKNVGIM